MDTHPSTRKDGEGIKRRSKHILEEASTVAILIPKPNQTPPQRSKNAFPSGRLTRWCRRFILLAIPLAVLKFRLAAIPRKLSSIHSGHEVGLKFHAACGTTLPKDTRLLLLTNVIEVHGSTAMISLLMSSPYISNLCRNQKRECEGYLMARDIVCKNQSNRTGCLRPTNYGTVKMALHGDSIAAPPTDYNQEFRDLNRFNILDIHAKSWQLDRPILQDKLFPREVGYQELVDLAYEAGIPPKMQKNHDIRHLLQAHIFQWVPLCVMRMQSSNSAKLKNRPRSFLRTEIWSLERMKYQHERLRQQGIPALVINYADILFREDFALSQVNSFLPCSQQTIHTHHVAVLGQDVFLGNRWKVRGSVHDFAKDKDASECCGYNAETATCTDRTFYNLAPPHLLLQLEALESYFRNHSQASVVDIL